MRIEPRDEFAEIERLRMRVADLEAELIEVRRWANEEVGESQARTYWLDRWHVDLNKMMERPVAGRVRAAARGVRAAFRAVRRFKRRLVT